MPEIIRGKQPTPLKCVMYGPEGIGKTTFATQWPKPIFLDFEGGTHHFEVDRIRIESGGELDAAMAYLKTGSGYRTLVFDTADWLDKLFLRAVCDKGDNQGPKNGIEDFGYGKGYVFLQEKWAAFLDRLNRFAKDTGMHVLFLAHAAIRKFEQPDESGAYDRWELKCSKTVSPLLKEWADMLLFANYKIFVVDKDRDGNKKKATGGNRVIYTEHRPTHDAKNRFGFPGELAFAPAALAPEIRSAIEQNDVKEDCLVMTSVKAGGQTGEPEPEAAPPIQPPSPAPEMSEAEAKAEAEAERARLLKELRTNLKAANLTETQLQREVARKKIVPDDMKPEQYHTDLLKRIVGNWETIAKNIIINCKETKHD